MKATLQSEGERPAQIEGSPRFESGTLDVILAIQSRGGAMPLPIGIRKEMENETVFPDYER